MAHKSDQAESGGDVEVELQEKGVELQEKGSLLQVEPAKAASAGESVENEKFNRAVGTVVLGAFYVGISSSMIFFNKQLLREQVFPYPAFLTSSHQVTAGCMAYGLMQFNPEWLPSFHTVFPKEKALSLGEFIQTMAPFFALAFGFAYSLVAGNYAYTVAPVTFLQMIKEGQIVFIYPLTVFFGLDTYRLQSFVCVIFIAIFGCMAVGGSPAFSITGLLIQGSSSFAGAMQQVITQRVMSRFGNAKLDPLTTVLCSAPAALFWLMIPNIVLWDPLIVDRLMLFWRALLLNNLLAFGLQVTMAIAIRNLSAVGLACCSVLKDILIVIVGGVWLGEPVGGTQIIGFIGATTGISLYSAMKLCPENFSCIGL